MGSSVLSTGHKKSRKLDHVTEESSIYVNAEDEIITNVN